MTDTDEEGLEDMNMMKEVEDEGRRKDEETEIVENPYMMEEGLNDEESEEEKEEIVEHEQKEALDDMDKELRMHMQSMNLSFPDEEIDRIADRLLHKMAEREEANKSKMEESDFQAKLAQLTETDTQLVCVDCVNYGFCKDVPKQLARYRPGTFGYFKKLDGTRTVKKQRRETIKGHFTSPLHLWCKQYGREKKISEDKYVKLNREACTRVVTNAIHCFKNSLSAKDLVSLIDKDQLLMPTNNATKNDGMQQFFHFRDIVFNKLARGIKDSFQKVSSASFTLDKVTVLKDPYTVLLTYFFHHGKIGCILNSSHPMKSHEYSGEATAVMVGLDLMASLELTKEEVGKVFHHGVYDGVYAAAEERVAGGGCLSLLKHFANWCGVDENNFTGLWDQGHKFQLIYGDALLKSKKFKEVNKVAFGIMAEFSSGKSKLQFKELAEELQHPVIANVNFQETRWVRATLSGYQSFFRNLSTLYNIIGKQEAGYAAEADATHQKEMEKKRKQLTDGYNIAFAVGLAQLLDVYSHASLEAQHLSYFPTTVMKAIKEFEEQLTKWQVS